MDDTAGSVVSVIVKTLPIPRKPADGDRVTLWTNFSAEGDGVGVSERVGVTLAVGDTEAESDGCVVTDTDEVDEVVAVLDDDGWALMLLVLVPDGVTAELGRLPEVLSLGVGNVDELGDEEKIVQVTELDTDCVSLGVPVADEVSDADCVAVDDAVQVDVAVSEGDVVSDSDADGVLDGVPD